MESVGHGVNFSTWSQLLKHLLYLIQEDWIKNNGYGFVSLACFFMQETTPLGKPLTGRPLPTWDLSYTVWSDFVGFSPFLGWEICKDESLLFLDLKKILFLPKALT